VSKYPKFTIITPSFNQGKYLEKTIRSVVVDQKYPNLEYLIMDGGSSDNSVDIIKKYAGLYPHVIKWRSHTDSGQVSAVNEGLRKASGDVVSYLNSDDFYLPGVFSKIAEYFHSHPDKKWLVGNCQVTQPNLQWTFWLKSIWPVDVYRWGLKIFNTINQPSVFLTKTLTAKVGKFDESLKFAFDYDYWLKSSQVGLPGKLNTFLAVFRIHSASKGNTGYAGQFREDWQVVRRYSRHPLILFYHLLGSLLTVMVYRFLK
jgi:glycosyltransferase involved in cell wall biosynthesis